MAVAQATLARGQQPIDIDERDRPETLPYCHECEEYILQSRWSRHREHDLDALDEMSGSDDGQTSPSYDEDGDDNSENDEPQVVGAEYTVTLDYNASHRFTVVAGYEDEAVEKAKDMVEWGTATDGHHLNTDIRENREITEDEDEADEYDLGY